MSTKSAATLAKGLRLLSAIMADEGRSTLSAIAATEGLPLPTAHRLALTLEAEGFLTRGSKGRYHGGPELARLRSGGSPAHIAAARLRHPLAQLAHKFGAYVHFGVLDGGMVTYLVKERGTDDPLFTEEHMQLEAYCSAVGKVLLAAMPRLELDAYLANGPFVALTERTITEPEALRSEISEVRASGVAYDRLEIRDDLFCIGVPVRGDDGEVIGAISASLLGGTPDAATIARVRRELDRIAGPRLP